MSSPSKVIPSRPGCDILAGLKLRQTREDIGQGHRKADPRIVPLGTRDLALRIRRERHEHSHDPSPDIDQRSTVIAGRHLGIGLDRPAPDPILGAQHAHGDIRLLGVERSSHRDGPLPNRHLTYRDCLRDGQRLRKVRLEQHQHAAVVASHNPGRRTLAVGQRHQDRSGLPKEIEGAGDDPTLGSDNQSRRRSFAQQHAAQLFDPADRLNPHHGRRDRRDRSSDRSLLQFGQVRFRRVDRNPGQQNRSDRRSARLMPHHPTESP